MTEVYQLPLFASEKRCTKCGVTKLLDSFPRDSQKRDGLCPSCKACRCAAVRAYTVAHPEKRRAYYEATAERQRAKTREWRAAHPERARASYHAWRKENRDKALAATEAWRATHREHERAYRIARYASDPQRFLAQGRAYRLAHPEKARDRERRYKAANREKVVAQHRRWRERNRIHNYQLQRDWRARNPSYHRLWQRRRRIEHPGACRAREQRRRARKQQAPGQFTEAEIAALEVAQAGLCAYCLEPYGRYHIEHKQPLSRGGSNFVSNLCLACPSCNLRKNTKTEAEFRAWLAALR